MKKNDLTPSPNLHNFKDIPKLPELTPTEIIGALIGASNNDEVNTIVWRNFDTFHDNPALFRILKDTRHRIWRLRKATRTQWSSLLN